MGVELPEAEKRLVERLYGARPERRVAIDASIDEVVAARLRGESRELGEELVKRGVLDRVELARLRGELSARAQAAKRPSEAARSLQQGASEASDRSVELSARAQAAKRPSEAARSLQQGASEASDRSVEPPPKTPSELQRETAKLDLRGRRPPPELRAPRGGAALAVLAVLLVGALWWRLQRAPAAPPPPAAPVVAPDPGDLPMAATPAPLEPAASEGPGGSEELDLARDDARKLEERGDYAGALEVWRRLDPALRPRAADDEARLEALEAYRKDVDAAIDAAESHPDPGARERLRALLQDPRHASAAGRRLQAKLLELDAPGDLAVTKPAPKPAPSEPPERLEKAKERVAALAARIEAEKKARSEELSQAAARARERSEKNPLRVELGNVTLEGAIVTAYTESGFTLEAEKPARTKISFAWATARPELAYSVRRLAVRDTAREQFLLGRSCVESHLFDEARRAFARVRELDPKLGARLPDLDALEKASRLFRGRLARSGPDAITVRWDFSSPSQAEDLDDRRVASVKNGVLEVAGSGTFVCGFKEAAFEERVDVDASLAAATGARAALGVRLEPRTARAAEYLLVVRRDTGDVALWERREGGTRELDARPGAAKNATKLGLSVVGGQVRARVDGKALLKGAAAPGWSRASAVAGGIANRTGRVVFDGLEVRGKVRAEWLRKSFEEVEALLRGSLAGVDDLPVFDRPDGAAPLRALSVEEALDAEAAANVQAARIRLAGGTPLDLATAADGFARALERSPGAISPRYLRALALEKLGKPRSALADLEAALARAPRFAEALAARGRLLASLGRPKEGLEAAEAALALAPDLALAHAARAHAHFRSGDLEKALGSLDLALALDPWDEDVRGFRRNVRHVIEGPPWERRFSRTTPRFVVETDISQRKCELYAAHLEAMRGFYAARFPASSEAPRARVLVFDTAEGFHRYAELTTDDRVESLLGYWHPRYGQLLLYEDKDDASGEETLRVLNHESFHQYIQGVIPEIPYWLNEGLAEYFSTCRVDDAGAVSGEGGVLAARLADLRAFLKNGGPVRFARLANETPREFYQGPVAQKYAQAWSMVHFFERSDAKRVLEAYMAELARGRTAHEAFQETFAKEDLDKLEASWRRSVEELR